MIDSATTLAEIQAFLTKFAGQQKVLIHGYIFGNLPGLKTAIASHASSLTHAFIKELVSDAYPGAFLHSKRIIISDGFRRAVRNSDYPDEDFFGDLPFTYRSNSYDGFGDFSIVGNAWSEGGGPAYAVAIHLTLARPSEITVGQEIAVHHFISDQTEDSSDEAGKVLEAVAKVDRAARAGSLLISYGVTEFQRIHGSGSPPKLGPIKELSMIHHLELMSSLV